MYDLIQFLILIDKWWYTSSHIWSHIWSHITSRICWHIWWHICPCAYRQVMTYTSVCLLHDVYDLIQFLTYISVCLYIRTHTYICIAIRIYRRYIGIKNCVKSYTSYLYIRIRPVYTYAYRQVMTHTSVCLLHDMYDLIQFLMPIDKWSHIWWQIWWHICPCAYRQVMTYTSVCLLHDVYDLIQFLILIDKWWHTSSHIWSHI